jgi:hypothetical protein
MPDVSPSRRTIAQIEASLSRLENDPAPSAIDAIRIVDELRRLEREWREPVATPWRWVRRLIGRSPEWSVHTDLEALHRCYRRWKLASQRINDPQVSELRWQLDREFRG